MTILIKPFLYLIAFGPLAVLFASAIGLTRWLLIVRVRAISLGKFHLAPSERKVSRPVLFITPPTPGS